MDERDAMLSVMGITPLETPSTLYHYTSAEALLSIVRSGRIRASHIRYLNDMSEVSWMRRTVLMQLEARRDSAKSTEQIGAVSDLITMIEGRRPFNEFVASFSEKGDDLSQWRAYCPGGSGFSIGFASAAVRTQWVWNPAGGEPFFVGASLVKVQYLVDHGLSELNQQLDAVFELALRLDGTQGFHGPITKNEFFIAWLSTRASSFKNASFRDEKEWRLVLSKPHKPMPGQRFRAGKSSIIPYIEAELNRDYKSIAPANYIIDRVIVGPTPDPALSVEALQSLFLSVGHPEVQVEASGIPYRHW